MEHIQQRFKVNIVYAIREITEHGKHEVDQIVMKQQLEQYFQYCSNPIGYSCNWILLN